MRDPSHRAARRFDPHARLPPEAPCFRRPGSVRKRRLLAQGKRRPARKGGESMVRFLTSFMPIPQVRQMRFRPHLQPLRDPHPRQRHRGFLAQTLRHGHFPARSLPLRGQRFLVPLPLPQFLPHDPPRPAPPRASQREVLGPTGLETVNLDRVMTATNNCKPIDWTVLVKIRLDMTGFPSCSDAS